MTKAPTAAERRHMNRIAEMGCLVCGRPAALHHVVSTGYARTSKTHRLVSPLCGDHHQHGPDAIHVIGAANFNKLLGFDLLKWATEEWEKSNG